MKNFNEGDLQKLRILRLMQFPLFFVSAYNYNLSDFCVQKYKNR